MLQWGRVIDDAEIPHNNVADFGTTLLQWGRVIDDVTPQLRGLFFA
jgi:hypothetical protein